MLNERNFIRASLLMLLFFTSCSSWRQDPANHASVNFLMETLPGGQLSCNEILDVQEHLRDQEHIRMVDDLRYDIDLSIAPPESEAGLHAMKMVRREGAADFETVKYLFIKLEHSFQAGGQPSPWIAPNPDIVEGAQYVPCPEGDWIVITFKGENGAYWFEGTEILKIQLSPLVNQNHLNLIETIVLAENLDG